MPSVSRRDPLPDVQDDFRLLVESLHDQAVFLLDHDGRVLTWSAAAERITGFTTEDITGEPIATLYLADDTSSAKPARDLAAALASGQHREEGWRRHKTASRYWAEVVLCRLSDDARARYGVMLRDVSERRSVLREQEAIDSSHRLETLGQLAAGVAHDLNNLLMIVGGFCEGLREQPGMGDAQLRGLEHIAVAAEQGATLTSQLLAVSSRAAVKPDVIDLHSSLVQTSQLLKRTLGGKIRIEMDLAPTPMRVRMNHGEIGQILINLAINARDAMPTGGSFATSTRPVTLDAKGAADHQLTAGDYVQLDVRDSGEGMSPAVAARAFEPFFTTKPVGQGSGLGLATVHAIVKQSGGAIDLVTTPGAGTRFRIWLPLSQSEPGKATGPGNRETLPTGTETVLVVDDDPAVREIVVSMLRSLGYQPLEAGSGPEALSLIEQHAGEIALLITDVAMPDLNGPQLMGRARALAPAMKSIFISGIADDTEWTDVGGQAEATFLQKPFTRVALARTVRGVLGASAAQAAGEPRTAVPSRPSPPDGGDRPGADAEPQLAELLPTPVFVVQDTRFAYVNTAFARLMALEPRELVGHDSLERVHPEHRQDARQQWWATSRAATNDISHIVLRCGDGFERTVVVTTRPIVFGGRPATLATCTDVTGQPDALTVSVRMAALGRLAGGVAHEFNNLLLVIGGQLEKLQHALPNDPELEAAVEAIGGKVERAVHLTDQLLSFGRRQMLTPQVTDLNALVEDMEAPLRSRVGSTVTLLFNLADGIPPIRADRPRLQQVLWHLVDNARDAMPGGGTLTVAIDTIAIDSEMKARWGFLTVGRRFVRLRVIDTGSGMTPDVMPHVFEPFFTTKGRGKGAGMGLASVYGIVKQSSGYVFVERADAAGSCITVLLPAHEAARDDREASVRSRQTRSRPLEHPRVLLVEDDMAVRELFFDALARDGFDVCAATTAEQAMLQAADRTFDVLLTDIDLPGMNGAALAAALRAQSPGIAVVLMSGYPDDGTLAEAGLDESVVLMRKPFPMAELIAQLHGAIVMRPSANP